MNDQQHLKAYLRRIPQDLRVDFARRCGCSLSHLKFVAYGAKQLSAELAIAIERESAGEVRVETLRPDITWHVIRGSHGSHESGPEGVPL